MGEYDDCITGMDDNRLHLPPIREMKSPLFNPEPASAIYLHNLPVGDGILYPNLSECFQSIMA